MSDKKTKENIVNINKDMDSIKQLTKESTELLGRLSDKSYKSLIPKFNIPKFNIPVAGDLFKNNEINNLPIQRSFEMPTVDSRNRAERKEDFESEILKIDLQKITLLLDTLKNIENEEISMSEIKDLQQNITNALIKYKRTINTFEGLNSDLAVQLDYKRNELKFLAKADWKNKFRLFFFRMLWTILFVVSLFAVGYIDKEYEWAELPMSKYFNATK